ncbi:hypothetical protein F0U61_37655 [Archangium violaceum]|uniref:hypothetical protein n=1 Tax=Archangium violaceum TaxID=83451 RepID=UPI002B321E69|nr:hypothetical protein F0U61_37655 [Archangium violaceum]
MAVSLDLELSTLASATRGAEILADYQTRQGFMDEESEEDAPACVFSMLSLVRGRIEQVRRVIRGEEDPAHIWGPQNAIALPESLTDVEGDIVLFPWNARGMPLVLARPSCWGVEPEEREKRMALGLEERRPKEPKGPKERKSKEPKGHKGRKAKESAPGAEGEEPAPESSRIPGEEPKEPPPAAS